MANKVLGEKEEKAGVTGAVAEVVATPDPPLGYWEKVVKKLKRIGDVLKAASGIEDAKDATSEDVAKAVADDLNQAMEGLKTYVRLPRPSFN